LTMAPQRTHILFGACSFTVTMKIYRRANSKLDFTLLGFWV
jgi:hypothetical protein